MTTERRAAAKLAAPTINLASVVYDLDTYMRSRGADVSDALRRAGLVPGDLTDPDQRVPLLRYLELLEFCADLLGCLIEFIVNAARPILWAYDSIVRCPSE